MSGISSALVHSVPGHTFRVSVESVLWEEARSSGVPGLPTPFEVLTESVRDHLAGVLLGRVLRADMEEAVLWECADVMAAEWVRRFGVVA